MALKEFHRMWQEILRTSKDEIDAFRQSDLELAKQNGNYEMVVALYAGDQQAWGSE